MNIWTSLSTSYDVYSGCSSPYPQPYLIACLTRRKLNLAIPTMTELSIARTRIVMEVVKLHILFRMDLFLASYSHASSVSLILQLRKNSSSQNRFFFIIPNVELNSHFLFAVINFFTFFYHLFWIVYSPSLDNLLPFFHTPSSILFQHPPPHIFLFHFGILQEIGYSKSSGYS